MLDSTLDFLYGIDGELGDKVAGCLRGEGCDDETAAFVERMEKCESDGNEWWLSDDPNVVAYHQLHEPILLVDFGTFHGYVEQFLGRGVWTHEFGLDVDGLRAEADSKREELGYF